MLPFSTQKCENKAILEGLTQTFLTRHQVIVIDHDMYSQNRDEAGAHSTPSVKLLSITLESDSQLSRSTVIQKVPQLSAKYKFLDALGFYRRELYPECRNPTAEWSVYSDARCDMSTARISFENEKYYFMRRLVG